MEFELIERTENTLRIKVHNADASVMYPIVENLLSDDRVSEANYSVEHQELDDPVLFIKSISGQDPKNILIETAKEIYDRFSKVYEDMFPEEEE